MRRGFFFLCLASQPFAQTRPELRLLVGFALIAARSAYSENTRCINGISESEWMQNVPAPAIQRDVQRLMGRCLLRLQQYERLMKAMLANHELVGTMDKLAELRASKEKAHSNKTLGQLTTALFETLVVPEGVERDLLPDDTTPTDRISFAFSTRVPMESARLAEAQRALAELVRVRNDLVHHFIDQFDLWTEAGCGEAITHLTDTYIRIDSHYEELQAWCRGMVEANQLADQFIRSGAYREWQANCFAPDGTINWPMSGIVSALREATVHLSVEGWTSLEAAKTWLQATYPEQTPEKYGCRSWQQVLAESKLFELTYRTDESGRKCRWFKTREGR